MNVQEIKSLSNTELGDSLERSFESENKFSHVILLHLQELRERRVYAELGYTSLFWMLVKKYKQSESSVYQRLKALDLIRAVPDVQKTMLDGDVTLSSLSLGNSQELDLSVR
jgi:hypothetical protein